MQARKLYKKYRQFIEELADHPKARELWLADLQTALQQFEREAALLEPWSARLLREELCDQLEHEALRSASPHRQDVLLGAVTGFEQLSFSAARR
jgi:hypothetical protein